MVDIQRTLAETGIITSKLIVPQMGNVGLSNSTTKFYVKDKLTYTSATDDVPKSAILESGTIKEKSVEIYQTTNAETGASKWKLGLDINDDDFVIKDLVNDVDRITIDGTTGVITFNPPLSIPTTPTSGFTYQFNTQGLTQYDIPAYSYGFVGQGGYYDIPTGNQIFNNLFTGTPLGPPRAWNQTISPVTIPSGQLIINQSIIPGNIQYGFRTFDPARLPVVVNLKGSMFPGNPAQPIDGAIVNATAMHNTGGSALFTTCFNFTVGIVKRKFTGLGVVVDEIFEQEFCVPFRGTGYPGDLVYFNATFNIVMEFADPIGQEYEYVPFFNHNATDFSTGTAGVPLRWRDVVCTFYTMENII